MTKITKKIAIVLAVAMIALIGLTTMAFGIESGKNLTNNIVSASTGESNYNSTIDTNKDSLKVGDKIVRGLVPKFGEEQWNGKIQVVLHLGGDSFIFINVDPREMGLLKDDLIVEYRNYYVSGGKEYNQKLSNFRFIVNFYSNENLVGSHDVNKSNDDQAGFTYKSSSPNVDGLTVRVIVKTTGGVTREANFYFGDNYEDCIA